MLSVRHADPASPAPPPTAAVIDAALGELESVEATRTEMDSTGRITNIHVISVAGSPAKQIVRDIEAICKVRFDLALDRRCVSVASTRGSSRPAPVSTPPVAMPAVSSGVRVTSLRRIPPRPHVLESVDVQHGRDIPRSCRVTLRRGDAEFFHGEADGHRVVHSVEQMAANATLDALQKIDPRASQCRVEGVKTLAAFDHEIVLVGLWIPTPGVPMLVTGSAVMTDRREVAAAVAVLDATNRWLATSSDTSRLAEG